jgi:putative transposase
MYTYRKLTAQQQAEMVTERMHRGFPWHGPPHPEAPKEYCIVTATCYEHRKILNSPQRLAWFEDSLLAALKDLRIPCAAWCVLPNHYHVLVQTTDMRAVARGLGQLHGRSSFQLNREDNRRGRQVWYRCQDRVMRSEAHYYTSLNYIHHNPVKHGYVKKWQEWPFSSVHWYLAAKGRDWLVELWREYPVLDYGKGWDDSD